MTDRQRTIACVALLTLFVTVLFADVLFLGRGLFLSDISRYFYPLKRVVRDTILSGHFPWWNRLYSGGQPMAANPAYAVFYPGQWPILIGTYRFGYNLHIILHVWLALCGAFLFLREDGRSVTASLVGAIAFATGGYFFSLLSGFSIAFIWAWAPVAGICLWRWRARGEARWLALAALALGMQFLIGEPVAVLQTWILIGVCAIGDVTTDRRRLKRDALAIVLLVVASLAVGAAQLVPAFDHLKDTSREGGLPYRNAVFFSSSPERPLELLFPHYFGSHIEVGPYYWGAARTHGAPYILNIYLGLVVAICAMASLFARPRYAIPLFIFCAFAYVAALGENGPIFNALYDLGIASRFRYPEKFLSLLVLPLIWLAARTLDAFMAGEPRARRAVIGVSVAVTLVASALALWSRTGAYAQWFFDHWMLPRNAHAQVLLALSQRYWWIAAGVAAALTLLIASRRLWTPALWSGALGVFAVLDVSQMPRELAPRMPASFFEPPGIVRALDRPLSDYAIFHIGDWLIEYLAFTRAGYGHYWTTRNGLVPPTGASWGVQNAIDRDYDETYLRPTRDMIDAMLYLNFKRVPAWWQPFAAMSNVRYVLDFRDFDQVARECGGHFEFSRPVSLRRFGAPAPRYYFATEIVQARTWREVADVVTTRGVIPGVAFVTSAPFTPGAGRVVRVDEGPSDARIEVEASAPSLLVMTITRHRWWHVAVDGRPVEPQPANIAYQGVPIPPGRHVVTMRYRNPLVLAGLAVSVLAIAVIIVIVLSGRRWKFETMTST